MSAQNPWFIVICGFIIVFVVSGSIKTYRARKLFKASFYTELYSGFLEYNLRRKSLKHLATSNWLNSQFGEHRIFYQMTQAKKGEAPQAYILVILSSGVYTILCKNYIGKLIGKNGKYEVQSVKKDKKTDVELKNTRKVSNPIAEIKDFKHRWKDFIGKDFVMNEIVVFTDDCLINVDENMKENIPFVSRNELFNTIKRIHSTSKEVLNDDEIIMLYKSFLKKNELI